MNEYYEMQRSRPDAVPQPVTERGAEGDGTKSHCRNLIKGSDKTGRGTLEGTSMK